MAHGPEILKAFAEEVKSVADALEPLAAKLKQSHAQPKLFEEFGQVIDRIHGTATILEFKEIARYARSMQSIGCKASQSTNAYAQGQVRDLITVCVPLLRKMQAVATDASQVKKLQYAMQKERERADELARKLFSTIKRTSSAA